MDERNYSKRLRQRPRLKPTILRNGFFRLFTVAEQVTIDKQHWILSIVADARVRSGDYDGIHLSKSNRKRIICVLAIAARSRIVVSSWKWFRLQFFCSFYICVIIVVTFVFGRARFLRTAIRCKTLQTNVVDGNRGIVKRSKSQKTIRIAYRCICENCWLISF